MKSLRHQFSNESDRLDRVGKGSGRSLGKSFTNFKESLLAAKAAAEDRVDKIYTLLVGGVKVAIKEGKYLAKQAFAMTTRDEAAVMADKPTKSRAGPRSKLVLA